MSNRNHFADRTVAIALGGVLALSGCQPPGSADSSAREPSPPNSTQGTQASSDEKPSGDREEPGSSSSQTAAGRQSDRQNDSSGNELRAPLLRDISSPKRGILGRQAPAFELESWVGADGNPRDEPLTLEELRGTFVFMLFWQSWCPGCHKRGFPTLQRVAEHFSGSERVAFLAIQTVFEGFSVNTADKIHEVREKFGLSIPMAHDDGDKHGQDRSYLMDRYRTGGTPWIVIVDPSGRVVFNDFHIPPDRAIAYLDKHTD